MTLTTYNREVKLLLLGSDSVTIDWGDGSPVEIHELKDTDSLDYWETKGGYNRYSHISSVKPPYTITIIGEKITHLQCDGQGLNDLDVSRNIELTELFCGRNQLTSLDISKNTQLTILDCGNNQLTSLDISKNTQLTILDCNKNELTSLDVSKNTQLSELYCSENELTSLDVSKNIQLGGLSCRFNMLTSLDVSKNLRLEMLYCKENRLTSLDVSENTQLELLDCSYNVLENLDVSKNIKLTVLDCDNIQLTNIDVSKNPNIVRLYCHSNQLKQLDVSKNTQLASLHCGNNQLTSLDLSRNRKLEYLYLNDNLLSAVALNALFESLNDKEHEDNDYRKNIDISGNPGNADCQMSIAEKKHWDFISEEDWDVAYSESDDTGIAFLIEGVYTNSKDDSCEILLDIKESDGEFTFALLVNESEFRGKVTVSADDNYITLEGIPWVENLGAVDEEGNSVEKNIKPAYGIDAYWKDGKLVIQNRGDSMNYYVKLACDSKFIRLIKIT